MLYNIFPRRLKISRLISILVHFLTMFLNHDLRTRHRENMTGQQNISLKKVVKPSNETVKLHNFNSNQNRGRKSIALWDQSLLRHHQSETH